MPSLLPYLLTLLLVNGGAYAVAFRDRSCLAFAFAFFLAPAINGVVALCGAIIAWKGRASPGSLTVGWAILLPVIFLAALEVAILSLPLRGC